MIRSPHLLLAALLGLAVPAQAVTFQARLSLTVRPTCEVAQLGVQSLTLRCTRDYRPVNLHALPELAGRLPAADLLLMVSTAGADGATLNDYTFRTAAQGWNGSVDFY
ncbi:hypothetical protein [Deinococcus sp. LM3]|uniref:hypothetical protein n=1 Tax=Deinococcus sp. LM3 TaxID=1938608 RepID=UPI00099239D7|nr:hypothetical protein [Deinococcus sp. LM3]OOV12457.1 hypothetical protein BXU09_16815 [Deinococcus sp. LM3]